MPYTSPIDVKELAKKGVFDEERFFRLISEQCNYVDSKVSRDFYLGFMRAITKELKDNGVVRLPHIGDFALVKQKPTVGFLGNRRANIEGKYMLKFYPNILWRKYFTKLSERPGKEGLLDPREKLLNRTL